MDVKKKTKKKKEAWVGWALDTLLVLVALGLWLEVVVVAGEVEEV